MEKSISLVDFQSMLGEIDVKLDNFDLRYREISNEEYERNIIRSIDYLTSNRKQSGSDYLPIWEAGWGENLDFFLKTGNLDTLVPKFVRQKEYIRFDGRWILPVGENFETNMVKIIREHFFHKYFRTVDLLVEIGCGTGLNLVHFLETYPSKSALGLDWSVNAVKIIDKLGCRFPGRITGKQFDMFHPPSTEDFKNILPRREVRIGVLTVGALEQLGVGYARMLDFLKTIANTFNVETILHMEAAFELYDKNVLFDLIPIKYIEKRNWLRGYFNDLKMLANQGEVSVVEMKKTFGSFFHDGYTVTVWNGVR